MAAVVQAADGALAHCDAAERRLCLGSAWSVQLRRIEVPEPDLHPTVLTGTRGDTQAVTVSDVHDRSAEGLAAG